MNQNTDATGSGRTRRAARRSTASRLAWIALLCVVACCLFPQSAAWGQTPSTLDTMRIVNSSVAVGDTFTVQFYLRNVDTIGAYNFRVIYDPTLISPLSDTVDNGGTLTITPEIVTPARQLSFEVFGAGMPAAGVYTFLAADFDQNPPLFLPGSGVSATMRWLVLSSASPQVTTIAFQNDPVDAQSFNTLTDYRARVFKRPTLVDGTITITGGSGTNHAPVINDCPAPVTTGPDQLVQFTVSASDQDGNNLSLTASNLPAGATFTPSNPVSGNTSVSGTFQWVPTSAQVGVSTVSFQAQDSPGLLTSGFCNVSITVSTDVSGNAPVVNCQAGSVTVDQGQAVQFIVSASDVDGDSMTLTGSSLPPGATITPANPMVGLGPLSMTFAWTPSFSQSGAFTVAFQAVDVTGRSSFCNTTIFVNEIEIDQLFSTSAPGQKPQGGVPGTPNVVIPINLVNAQSSYGVQFDFVYDPVIFTPTQVQTTDRLAGFQVYENLGDEPGRIRVVAFDLNGLPIAPGTTSLLFNVVGTVSSDVSPGAYQIFFENAWESVTPDPESPSIPLATSDGVIMVDNLGDANLDTRIDVADIVSVIGYILSNYTFDMRQFVAADVAATFSQLDVFDLQAIINLIFGIPLGPAPGRPGTETPATVALVYDPSDGPNGAYRLSTTSPIDVAGAQIELNYDPSTTAFSVPETDAAAGGFDMAFRDNGQGRLVALLIDPSNNSRIPSGQAAVLRLPLIRGDGLRPSVTLKSVKLAAGDASSIEVAGISPVPKSFVLMQNYPNPFNPSTTIEFSIGQESGGLPVDVHLDVFNVLGQKIITLAEGTLEPGRYQYEWHGTDGAGQSMASGLYFYRLIAGGQQEAKKMVLLK